MKSSFIKRGDEMEPMKPEQLAELLSRKLEDTSEDNESQRRGHWFESSIAHHTTKIHLTFS